MFSGALDVIRRSQARSAVCTTDRTRAALSPINTGAFLATGLCCHVGRHDVFCVLQKSTTQWEEKADPATWRFAAVAGQALTSVTLLSSSLQVACGSPRAMARRTRGRTWAGRGADFLVPDGSTPESEAVFNRCGAEGCVLGPHRQAGRVVKIGRAHV